MDKELQLVSLAFKGGQPIPPQYTCKGRGVSPPLNFLNVPTATKSLALIMHDPDSIQGDFTHWTVWDILPESSEIRADAVPVGAVQGANDSGTNAYFGPCPVPGSGIHRYFFEAYALDATLGLPAGSSRNQLTAAMNNHILASGHLIGTFSVD